MHKEFDKWNEVKKKVNNLSLRVFFHPREVWWCSLGINVGYEQDGKHEFYARPVIILRKFNNETCWAVPLTKKIKTGKYYTQIVFGKNIKNSAILSQMRLIDAKRLIDKIGVIKNKDYKKIKKAIISLVEN